MALRLLKYIAENGLVSVFDMARDGKKWNPYGPPLRIEEKLSELTEHELISYNVSTNRYRITEKGKEVSIILGFPILQEQEV